MSDATSIAFHGTITRVRRLPLAEFVRPSTARAVRPRSPGKCQRARFTSTVSAIESNTDATSHCIASRLAQPGAGKDTAPASGLSDAPWRRAVTLPGAYTA